MKALKRLTEKKYFMTILWILLIIAVWEIFATIVAATKRTPENILPHLSGIIESVISDRTINGGQTAIQMVMTNAAATLTFYPVATNKLAGFKSVSREKHELMYSYAANKWQIYTKTMIPACVPYFFTGLKISAPMAITASILVDTLQGGIGLGCLLSQALKGAMTRYVFWQIVFFSAIIGILSFSVMGLLEYILCPYKRKAKSTKE